ncbi:MAG: ABA4-like family protein [Flavitalea sp.]
MTNEQIFSACSTAAMIGWVILAFLPFWKSRDKYVLGIIIMLLSATYLWLIAKNFNPGVMENFSTLAGVQSLFHNEEMLLAGWVHYLAFDLFVGVYILRNARANSINHWITVPSMFLSFMFGPIGLLVYTITRTIITRKYLADAG